jgi:Ca2+-transporting ATPase
MSDQDRNSSYHSRSVSQVLESLDVEKPRGLTEQEVRRRRDKHGSNKLREAKQRGVWEIVIEQFKSMVIIVLVIAGTVALTFQHWAEGIAIGAVLLVNAALGFITEWKALRSMEALRDMGADAVRVRRDNHDLEIDSEKLVPGDIIVVDAGDVAPADIRLIESNNLRVNEAALTGESVPVRKATEALAEDIPLAERASMLYKGTTIDEGSGEGVVVRTGMQTELGRIADLTESAEKEATPLQKRLDRLGRRLAWITLSIAAMIAGIGLLAGQDTRKMIETAIALGVAAIPEGLPIVATIALARGMHLMARRNALIKKLPAVETLGATGIIFTDKTGTLTENRMTMQRVSTPAGDFQIDEENRQVQGDGDSNHPLLRRVIEVGVLCNNASLRDVDNDREPDEEQGDPTETALLRAGFMLDIERTQLLEKKPEEREVAFDADLMMMATYHRGKDGIEIAVKGAPARVLEVCDTIAEEDLNGGRTLNGDARREWLERSETLAAKGLRLLAMADKFLDTTEDEPYENLRFLGLVGLLDPPREKCGKRLMSVRLRASG